MKGGGRGVTRETKTDNYVRKDLLSGNRSRSRRWITKRRKQKRELQTSTDGVAF
jgi:hypothetical protein